MSALARRLMLLFVCSYCALAAATVPAYFVDGDGDQVSDEIDDCPYTHPGVQIDVKGCPLRRDDADLDAVPDDDDDCPYTSVGAIIDAKGCALDSDFDGVANGLDRCPRTPLALVVNGAGCTQGERSEALASQSAAIPAATPAAPMIKAPEIVAALPATVVSVAAEPVDRLPPTSPANSVEESPKLLLKFDFNSSRLGRGDLAMIEGYAKIFTRRLAGSANAVLKIHATADQRETDVAAVARMIAVRKVLVDSGIAVDRIRTERSVASGGAARNNRRVETEIVSP